MSILVEKYISGVWFTLGSYNTIQLAMDAGRDAYNADRNNVTKIRLTLDEGFYKEFVISGDWDATNGDMIDEIIIRALDGNNAVWHGDYNAGLDERGIFRLSTVNYASAVAVKVNFYNIVFMDMYADGNTPLIWENDTVAYDIKLEKVVVYGLDYVLMPEGNPKAYDLDVSNSTFIISNTFAFTALAFNRDYINPTIKTSHFKNFISGQGAQIWVADVDYPPALGGAIKGTAYTVHNNKFEGEWKLRVGGNVLKDGNNNIVQPLIYNNNFLCQTPFDKVADFLSDYVDDGDNEIALYKGYGILKIDKNDEPTNGNYYSGDTSTDGSLMQDGLGIVNIDNANKQVTVDTALTGTYDSMVLRVHYGIGDPKYYRIKMASQGDTVITLFEEVSGSPSTCDIIDDKVIDRREYLTLSGWTSDLFNPQDVTIINATGHYHDGKAWAEIEWVDDNNTPGSCRYNIYNGTDLVGTSWGTKFRDYSINGGNTYNYTIKAMKLINEGDNQRESAGVSVDIFVPNQDVYVSNLVLSDITTHSMKLDWDVSNSIEIVNYEVWRSEDGTNFTKIAEPTTNYYIDDGLTDGTHYWYKVRGYTIYGDYTEYSNTADAWTNVFVWATFDEVLINNGAGTELYVSWNSIPDVTYELQYSEDGTNWTTEYSGTGTNRVIQGLSVGTLYHLKLITTDGTNSNEDNTTKLMTDIPGNVQNLTLLEGFGGVVNVSWDTPLEPRLLDDISKYKVYRADDDNGSPGAWNYIDSVDYPESHLLVSVNSGISWFKVTTVDIDNNESDGVYDSIDVQEQGSTAHDVRLTVFKHRPWVWDTINIPGMFISWIWLYNDDETKYVDIYEALTDAGQQPSSYNYVGRFYFPETYTIKQYNTNIDGKRMSVKAEFSNGDVKYYHKDINLSDLIISTFGKNCSDGSGDCTETEAHVGFKVYLDYSGEVDFRSRVSGIFVGAIDEGVEADSGDNVTGGLLETIYPKPYGYLEAGTKQYAFTMFIRKFIGGAYLDLNTVYLNFRMDMDDYLPNVIEKTVVANDGENVVLDGEAVPGNNRSGSVLIPSWEQVAGNPVTLSDPNSWNPSFTVNGISQYKFKLTVLDDSSYYDDERAYTGVGYYTVNVKRGVVYVNGERYNGVMSLRIVKEANQPKFAELKINNYNGKRTNTIMPGDKVEVYYSKYAVSYPVKLFEGYVYKQPDYNKDITTVEALTKEVEFSNPVQEAIHQSGFPVIEVITNLLYNLKETYNINVNIFIDLNDIDKTIIYNGNTDFVGKNGLTILNELLAMLPGVVMYCEGDNLYIHKANITDRVQLDDTNIINMERTFLTRNVGAVYIQSNGHGAQFPKIKRHGQVYSEKYTTLNSDADCEIVAKNIYERITDGVISQIDIELKDKYFTWMVGEKLTINSNKFSINQVMELNRFEIDITGSSETTRLRLGNINVRFDDIFKVD